MDWKRVQAAAIRFGYTFLFAFFAQPAIASLATGEWSITWQQAGAAAVAAFVYAAKKYIAPDTTL